MGGTWLPYGGQNFLEPMALGKPVVVGESIYNFEQIGKEALYKQLLLQSLSVQEALEKSIQMLHANHSEVGDFDANLLLDFVKRKCGVVNRLIDVLTLTMGRSPSLL